MQVVSTIYAYHIVPFPNGIITEKPRKKRKKKKPKRLIDPSHFTLFASRVSNIRLQFMCVV